jgi:hypothetical protein
MGWVELNYSLHSFLIPGFFFFEVNVVGVIFPPEEISLLTPTPPSRLPWPCTSAKRRSFGPGHGNETEQYARLSRVPSPSVPGETLAIGKHFSERSRLPKPDKVTVCIEFINSKQPQWQRELLDIYDLSLFFKCPDTC